MAQFRKWFGSHMQQIRVEAYSGKDAQHTTMYLEFSRDERSITFALGIWHLFTIFLTITHRFIPGYNGNISDMERTIGMSIFDGSLWLYLWSDRTGWGPDRTYYFTPMDFFFGRMKLDKVLLTDPFTEFLPMPEKTYPIEVLIWRYTYWRPRLPFWKDVVQKIELNCDEGIPIPGKGENSWDLDDDASFSISCIASTVDEARNTWQDSIFKTRMKYGGQYWMPSA